MNLVIVVLAVIVFVALFYLLLRPMRIPRDPDREGIEDEVSAQAYYRVSRWPLFVFVRCIILRFLAKMKPAGLLIDIGCGPGFLTAHVNRKFPEVKVSGLDISESALKKAGQTFPLEFYPGLEFIQADAQQLPCADNSIDFFISSLSLHHWPDAHQVFQEIYRTLKPGGQFLIFDLRRNTPVLFYLILAAGQKLFAPKSIRRINGGVGSFWASYTPAEIKLMLSEIPPENLQVKSNLGWMYITGAKSAKS